MSYISYSDVITGLHERLETVPGLAQLNDDGDVCNMLRYEPETIVQTPLLYSLLDTFQRDQHGQMTSMIYRVLHRIVIQWQDQEQAELELIALVNAVPASIDVDPTLGGRVDKGLARISDGATGFVVISGTQYRCLDFYSSVTTKSSMRSGI